MKPKKFNEDRLVKYARYLQCGNLKCEKFYSTIEKKESTEDQIEESKRRPLLFLPIMELPIIFPKEWYYDRNYMPVYKENKAQETISSVIEFFGINRYIFYHIWSPGAQMIQVYGGKTLGPKPTLKDIASNILDLVEVVKYYENIKDISTPTFLN